MEEGRCGFLGDQMGFNENHQLHLTLGYQEQDPDEDSHFMELSRYEGGWGVSEGRGIAVWRGGEWGGSDGQSKTVCCWPPAMGLIFFCHCNHCIL